MVSSLSREVVEHMLVNHFVRMWERTFKDQSPYPKVLKGFDPWDGPADQKESKLKKSFYTACSSRVLGFFGHLGLSTWIFFFHLCSPVPSSRLGKSLNGQWCKHLPIAHFLAGEEEGIGLPVSGEDRAPRLGPKDKSATEGKSP